MITTLSSFTHFRSSESEFSVSFWFWLRTESEWDKIFFWWNETESVFFWWDETELDFFFMKWDRIRFFFSGMKQDQILFSWNGTGPEIFSWNEMRQKAGAALMRWDRAFMGQDVPSWSFGQPICNKLQRKKNVISSSNQYKLKKKSEFSEQKHDKK